MITGRSVNTLPSEASARPEDTLIMSLEAVSHHYGTYFFTLSRHYPDLAAKAASGSRSAAGAGGAAAHARLVAARGGALRRCSNAPRKTSVAFFL
jgi:hypothetical protein